MLVWILIWFPRSTCVSNVHFAILVNGGPTSFFWGKRGLCQGRPLSPLLFLIIIDGFSCLIGDAKSKGLLKGIKVLDSQYISHILFVDDVLLFRCGNRLELKCYYDILNLFSLASRIEVNPSKSCFIVPGGVVDDHILVSLLDGLH